MIRLSVSSHQELGTSDPKRSKIVDLVGSNCLDMNKGIFKLGKLVTPRNVDCSTFCIRQLFCYS